MVDSIWKYGLIVVLLLVILPASAQQKTDSLIINVGSSKIIVLVNDPKDLDELAQYDLNAILKDLRLKLNADSTLVDENERSMSDTTIVVNQKSEETTRDNDRWESRDDDRWRSRDDDRWRNDDSWRSSDNTSGTRRRTRSSRHLLNFDLGTNNYLSNGEFPESSNAQYAVRPWGSWYFSINSVYQKQLKDRFYIEIGPGISWYNFKFEDDNTRVVEAGDQTQFISVIEPDRDPKKSKLTATFLNVTVVPMFQFGRERRRRSIGRWGDINDWRDIKIGGSDGGFRFGVGGYAGYRLGSRTKVKYDGGKKDKNRDNFNLTSFRYGVRVQMGFRGTDLFFNYDLNELFNQGRGPDLNAFSFGIIL